MIDSIGQEAVVGDYFSYAQRSGSSVYVELFQLLSVDETTKKVKAMGQNESRGKKWSYNFDTGKGEFGPCKPKQSTLHCFPSRATILKGYNG